MSVKNDFDRMKVSSVIIKILLLSIIALITYLLVGVILKNIPTSLISFLFTITLHFIILFILIRSFNKYHISINNLLGSLSIRKEHWLKLISIKFLILIFGALSVTVIFTLLALVNSGFLTFILTDIDLSSTESNFLYSLLFYVLSFTLAPVMEELLFRGYLFNKWGAKHGVVKAMIFSSLLFSFVHFDSGFMAHFFSGIFYCLVYMKTRKLIVPILLHAFHNIVAGAVIFLPTDNTAYEGDLLIESIKKMEFVFYLGTALFILLIPIVSYILYRYYRSVSLLTPYQQNKEFTL
ncbi:lysostaphin resistance A-like protein [Fredinandcohnia humi]